MAQDNLYDLIQSLSKSEKRYFTVNGGKEDSNHIRLFQLMKSMKEFDEKRLKGIFPKNLSWEKGNLYKLILKHMRNCRSDKSAYAEIKGAILDARFLMERGLYEQSLKQIHKGKEVAEKFLRYGDLSELNQLERKILFILKPETLQNDINELIEEQEEILRKIQSEVHSFSAYHFSGLAFLKQLSLPSKALKEEFLKEFAAKNDFDFSILSPRAKYNYLLSRKFRAQLIGEFESVLNYAKEIINWWDQNPAIKQEERYQYILDSFNYLASCLFLKKHDEVLRILIQMEEEEPKNILEEKTLFKLLIQNKHLYYINIGDFTKAKKEYFKISKKLSTICLDNKSRTVIYINFAILFFFTEDFKDCITVVDEMLKKRKVKNRQSLQWTGKLLKSICYLEIGDIDNFDSHFRSTKRSFISEGLTEKSFELKFLHFLKDLSKSPLSEHEGIYQQISSLIIDKKNNPNNIKLLGLDEYYFWIRSKFEKTPMVKLFQETL